MPDDKSTVKIVNEAANRLYYKLEGIDIETLDISDYFILGGNIDG